MSKSKIIYGKIITLDDKDTIAQAMYIKDGKIAFVGSRKQVEKFKKDKPLVLDYGSDCIYPGFMDGHMHGCVAATQIYGYVDLSAGKTIQDYVDIMKKYIAKHPGQPTYVGTNWLVQNLDRYPTKKDLDVIDTDAMIYMMTEDRHIVWVNSKVLEHFNINKNTAAELGMSNCPVFDDGEPTGIFADSPALTLTSSIKIPPDISRRGYIEWQKQAFSLGYTAVCDAAVIESKATRICSRYAELVEAGIWKLRTYGVYLVQAMDDNWDKQIGYAKEFCQKFNSEYFKIYGIKLFEDGVVEAHTAWMLEDYADMPGYRSKPIIPDKNRLIEVISTANKMDLVAHIHSIGDASTQFVVDAIEKSQQQTGIKDPRNAIAHLEAVTKEDIVKIGKNHIVACVAPLWIPALGKYSQTEIKYLGKERHLGLCPIKSFFDANAPTVFHSDYPSCHTASIQDTLFRAVTRYSAQLGKESLRGAQEAISRKQALYAMTRNIAYSFKEEKRLGTIEAGKIANFTIFDTDFLTCDVLDIAKAKLVNTIVDGEIVH